MFTGSPARQVEVVLEVPQVVQEASAAATSLTVRLRVLSAGVRERSLDLDLGVGGTGEDGITVTERFSMYVLTLVFCWCTPV